MRNALRTLFPDIIKNRTITERVKTFEDAVEELPVEHPFVQQWVKFNNSLFGSKIDKDNADLHAYYKLRIITAALNEGWQPKFSEYSARWYPKFYLYSKREYEKECNGRKSDRSMIVTDNYDTEFTNFVFEQAIVDSFRSGKFRLYYKDPELAEYSGKQFINLWADLNLIRK